jgi:protein SCO1/2
MRAMIGPMLRILVVGLVLLVAVMLTAQRLRTTPPQPENATVFETSLALPDFELGTSDGRRFSKDDLDDHYSLLFFGFTNCPDICPLTMAALAGAYETLGRDDAAALPAVVFISVDPNRDTPARVGDYVHAFDSRFVGITGDRASLDPLLRTLGVTVMTHAVAGSDSYSVTHNGTIYVIGPDAELIATLDTDLTAMQIASDFRRIRALHRRASGARTTT